MAIEFTRKKKCKSFTLALLQSFLQQSIPFLLGLPNTFGDYDETPEYTAQQLEVSEDYHANFSL